MRYRRSHHRYHWAVFFIGCLSVLSLCANLWAETSSSADSVPILSADAQFSYAIERFENSDYQTAIVEFKRFVHFFAKDPRANGALYHIGLCYFRLAKYDAALKYFRKTLDKYPDSKFALESRFRISRCYFRMNDPDAAERTLLKIIEASEKRTTRDRARYRLGWLCLETARLGQAQTWFDRMTPSGKSVYQVAALEKGIDRMGDLPGKSPVLAGAFSIIPGGGYLYCGRYKDATIAFFINAALMGAACESFDNGLEILGGLISLIDLGFYAGSIYGGISSAHKFNRSAYEQAVEDLKAHTQPPNFSATHQKSGLEITFGYRF